MAVSIPLLHHLIFFKTPPSSLLFIEPICLTTSLKLHKPFRTIINPISHASSSYPPPPLSFFLKHSSSFSFSSSSFSSSFSHPQTLSANVLLNEDITFDLDTENEIDDDDEEDLIEEEGKEDIVEAQVKQEPEPLSKDSSNTNINSVLQLPKLSVKEKKELASYAHSLGKKLKSQQVGKSGVTSTLAAAFVENLESNELLKV